MDSHVTPAPRPPIFPLPWHTHWIRTESIAADETVCSVCVAELVKVCLEWRGRKEEKKSKSAGSRRREESFCGFSVWWTFWCLDGKRGLLGGGLRGAEIYRTPPSSSPPSPPPPSTALLHPFKIRGFVFSLNHGLVLRTVLKKKKKLKVSRWNTLPSYISSRSGMLSL